MERGFPPKGLYVPGEMQAWSILDKLRRDGRNGCYSAHLLVGKMNIVQAGNIQILHVRYRHCVTATLRRRHISSIPTRRNVLEAPMER